MDLSDVTEDELREQLALLGYNEVSDSMLSQLKLDVQNLAAQERSRNTSMTSNSTADSYGREMYGNYRRRYDSLDDSHNVPTASTSAKHYAPVGMSKVRTENEATGYDHRYAAATRPKDYRTVYIPSAGLDISTDKDYSIYTDDEHQNKPPTTFHWQHPTVRDRPDPDTTLETGSQTSERRFIKRKVLRKMNGESQVCDESVTTEDTDDLADIRERLRNLPLTKDEVRSQSSQRRPQSARETPMFRLPEEYSGPKSLIRPMTADPHTRNLKKNDPVSRYQRYQNQWRSQRAPGEKAHKSLRWNVREHMLYHDPVIEKKQHKVVQPNNYKIPTEKKRKALRWQIRNDLAQGLIPQSVFE